MSDPSGIHWTDTDVQEAARDARALVTARMEATPGALSPDLDTIINEMAGKALGAKDPHRAVVVHLATMGAFAIGLSTELTMPEAPPGVTSEEVGANIRAALFLHLEQRGYL